MGDKKNKFFLQSFFKDGKTIGSIHPSSKSLAKKMLKDIDFSEAKTIVEFGPGTGVFTRMIIDKKLPTTNFYIFELYEPFYKSLVEEFKDSPNVFIFNEKAQDLKNHVSPSSVDCVISSLPLTNMNNITTIRILETAKNALKNGGIFVQFQYSLNARKLLNKIFDDIHLDFTLNNIPPAFVYKCKKK